VCKEILEDMRYITERLCAASPEPPPDNYMLEETKKCVHCSKSLTRPLDSGHWMCERCYLTQYKGKAL